MSDKKDKEARPAKGKGLLIKAVLGAVLVAAGGGGTFALVQSGMVGGHRDHGGMSALRSGHMPLDKVRNLARALADQADDDHFGLGSGGDHVEQDRLADARSGHHADALADAEGGERVQGAHPGVERRGYRAAVERRRAVVEERAAATARLIGRGRDAPALGTRRGFGTGLE